MVCIVHISFLKKKKCEMDLWQWHCRNRRKKIVAIGLRQCHCRNMGENFVAIVAMPLPKMGGKKIVVTEIWEGIKKKCYVHKIFTTNHM